MTPTPGFSAPDRWLYVVLALVALGLAVWTWRPPRDAGRHPLRRLGARVLPLLALSLGLLAASGFDPMDSSVRALRLNGVRPTLEVLGTLAWLAALLAALGMPLPRRLLPGWATDDAQGDPVRPGGRGGSGAPG